MDPILRETYSRCFALNEAQHSADTVTRPHKRARTTSQLHSENPVIISETVANLFMMLGLEPATELADLSERIKYMLS